MSNIVDIQRRLRELARIRIGDQAATSSGGKRPRKLEAFRLTSRDENFVRAAAEQYGGEPRPWAAPDGPQWEVYTTARELPVVVPPTDMAFSQAYELWSAGGCQRRCDGVTDTIGDQACVCDPEKRQCAITTRLSVILHELPGLGVCRLETHGFYAAVELGGAVELVNSAFAKGQLLPARLLLEQRQVKRAGKDGKPQTRNFVVPCLDFPMSFGALQSAAPAAGMGAAAVLDAPRFTPVPVAELPEAPTASVAEQLAAAPAPRQQRANAAEPIRPTGMKPRVHEVSGAPLPPAPGDGEHEGSATVAAVSDPSPPPDDDGPTMPLPQRVAMWCADAGLDDDGRHAFLAAATGGRISSAKDVTPADVADLRAKLVQVKRGQLVVGERDGRPVLLWTARDGAVEVEGDVEAGQATIGSPSPSSSELVPDWSRMRVAELAAACRERGITPAGTKAELVAVLKEHAA